MGKLNILKMLIFHKLIYTFNTILIKTPRGFFKEIIKMGIKYIWQNK